MELYGKSELDVYLDEGVHISEDDSKFNVLEWWKMNYLKFRVLSKMACDILSIPITTVASEFSFSAAGRVIDPYRATLDAKTVQVLLCGEDWLRSFYGIKRKKRVFSFYNLIYVSYLFLVLNFPYLTICYFCRIKKISRKLHYLHEKCVKSYYGNLIFNFEFYCLFISKIFQIKLMMLHVFV